MAANAPRRPAELALSWFAVVWCLICGWAIIRFDLVAYRQLEDLTIPLALPTILAFGSALAATLKRPRVQLAFAMLLSVEILLAMLSIGAFYGPAGLTSLWAAVLAVTEARNAQAT